VYAVGTDQLHLESGAGKTSSGRSGWFPLVRLSSRRRVLSGALDILNMDGRLEIFARHWDDRTVWHIWQTRPGSVENILETPCSGITDSEEKSADLPFPGL
jgi:hypothetical protein